jgi:hypothetical protein
MLEGDLDSVSLDWFKFPGHLVLEVRLTTEFKETGNWH